jgi:hypothetical protein
MPTKLKNKPKHSGKLPLLKKEYRSKQITVRSSLDELMSIEIAAHDQLVDETANEMLRQNNSQKTPICT